MLFAYPPALVLRNGSRPIAMEEVDMMKAGITIVLRKTSRSPPNVHYFAEIVCHRMVLNESCVAPRTWKLQKSIHIWRKWNHVTDHVRTLGCAMVSSDITLIIHPNHNIAYDCDESEGREAVTEAECVAYVSIVDRHKIDTMFANHLGLISNTSMNC